jgi:AmmeMemoRadiSam system protein A
MASAGAKRLAAQPPRAEQMSTSARTTTPSALTAAQRAAVLTVAADAIAAALRTGEHLVVESNPYDPPLCDPGASFVTLERGDELLGCIGTLEPVRPLISDVAHNAVAAAFSDPRLPAISRADYPVMAIEVSVLSDLVPIRAASLADLARELRPGVDGVVIEAPPARATFLPAVWRHFGDDVDAFLTALWRKAGLPHRSWPVGARCSRYTAEKMVDPGPRLITT